MECSWARWFARAPGQDTAPEDSADRSSGVEGALAAEEDSVEAVVSEAEDFPEAGVVSAEAAAPADGRAFEIRD